MAIQIKRSAVASKIPLVADLALGELAINTNDGKLFLKKSVGGVETIVDVTAAGGATGTVTSVAALTIGTTGTDLSSTVATNTSTPVITLQVPNASATSRGALSSTDWSVFNGKQAAGTYATGTGSASGVNTGDETLATIKTKLGVTTLSGSNTGDQVLPTTLPASDVSAWAKAATKPTYTYSEVGAAASAHTHSYQAADGDLLAIGGLVGTSGLLRKTAADTWTLDTSTFATGSGTASGTNTGDQTTVSGASGRIAFADRRSTVQTPAQFGPGVDWSFMTNTTDGLADGGTYHGVMHYQPYSDASGGGAYELGFTDNNNLWLRGSSGALTAWAAWKQLAFTSSNITGTATNITGTYAGTITSSQVTTALTFTPYNSTNPAGYTSNTGTVTGVTATSPVTSSGGSTPVVSLSAGYGDTLNPYASKTANFVLAAPTGVAGVPTFRAIVAADIPTLNQNTTGSSGSCTGNAASASSVAASGITGQTGMWTSAARPGAYRLYRNDSNDPYNIQTTWSADVSGYWSLRGYYNDGYHAPCYVGYAGYSNTAGSAPANGGTSAACSGNAATATTATNVSGGTVNSTTLNVAGNGSSADPYGTAAVTEPANANNYSYYGLTRAGNLGAGFGLAGTTGALGLGANAFWFGGATSGASGVLSGTAWIAFNASSFVANGTVTATNHIGPGTGLTGTATSLSIGGTAATATLSSIAGGVVWENTQTIAANYTMTAGRSGTSAGPITINAGVTVTIPSGSRWVVV